MNKLTSPDSIWITTQQERLLKAALLQGNEAVSSWKNWRSELDFETIDPGSYRLLPLLYYNLTKLGIKDPLLNRLKGIYRRSWYENQMLSQKAIRLLQMFSTAGIKTIVLKGVALINAYYRDYGLRPMSDIDILVPTQQAAESVKIMTKSGWEPAYRSPENIIPIIHSCDFKNPDDSQHLDLHWHLFIECCQPEADNDFWDAAQEIKIRNISTQVLNPADQLLHTIIHGMKWSIIPPFRWVADAYTIINSSENEIDWNRIILQAEKRRLVLPLRYGLEYLVNTFKASVPESILQRIKEAVVTKAEYAEYRCKIEDQKKKLLGNIPVLWFDSLRLSESTSVRVKLLGFIKYLKHFWNLESSWHLPLYALSLTMNKIKMMRQRLLNKRSKLLIRHP